MTNRFEDFDPFRDRDYVRRMLGDDDFNRLFPDLDRRLTEDTGEAPDGDEGGMGFEDNLGVSDDSPEPLPVDPTEVPDRSSPVSGPTGGGAVQDDAAPAVDAVPEDRRDAALNQDPPAQGHVPAPAEPRGGEGQRTRVRDPWLPELPERDPRAREKMRWWRYWKKALGRRAQAGTDDRSQLLAHGLVTYIEWVLIRNLHQAVPHDREPWVLDRRQREIQLRERRLRDTELQRLRPFKGWRGIISWVLGKKPVSLDIYYLREIVRMEREPDDVLSQEVLEALEFWEEHARLNGGEDLSDVDLS